MIKKINCIICGRLVGAEDTETGEAEYERGYRESGPYCKACYDSNVLAEVPFLGGCDGEEDILHEE